MLPDSKISKNILILLLAHGLAPAAVSAQPQVEIEMIGGFGEWGKQVGKFDWIGGLALDQEGRIIIADNDNHRIQRCTFDGECEAFGKRGSKLGEFIWPLGIDVDGLGRIIVSEAGNDRIQLRDPDGTWSSFGSTGVNGLPGQFRLPAGLHVDDQGMIVIADEKNHRIQVCDDAGNCSAFGAMGSDVGFFNTPRDVAVASQGRILVADYWNHRIQICSYAGECTAMGGYGAELGQFRNPAGIAVDAKDRIFIGESGNSRVQICEFDGSCAAFGEYGTEPGQFFNPQAIAVDGQDRIYVGELENSRVQIFQATYTEVMPEFYTVGGSVSGLTGSGLVLRNNGGDDLVITGDGNFTFPASLEDGSSYSIAVHTQPTGPNQTCTVSNGSGTLSGANVTNVSVTCVTETYTVGGTVNGLAGSGLVLQNNGGDDLAITGDGAFTFATALVDGDGYAVTVDVQPSDPDQTCTVSKGSGTLSGGDVTNVAVICATNPPDTYTVGGTVSGLAGSGLVLQNNGGDDLAVSANGAFTFTTAIADGANYAVTVRTQPAGPAQTCTVSNGSGVLGGASVHNVSVICVTVAVFLINAGLNDAWFDEATPGQGFFIIVFPDTGIVFLAWFTYDVERPPQDVAALLGEPGQRWVTAQGPFEGDTATLTAYLTQGGVFDKAEPQAITDVNNPIGRITIVWHDCESATLTYDIDPPGVMGEIPLRRIVPDNVNLCEALMAP